MASVEQLTERVLYRLSLDMKVRALAERLLHRFAETVGVLPVSEKHLHSESGHLNGYAFVEIRSLVPKVAN